MSWDTSPNPHRPAPRSVAQIMRAVLWALLPAVACHIWLFGAGILIQLALASLFALLIEAIMLRLRQQPLRPFLNDGSALVTAWLFALSMPTLAPWWVSFVGMLFAIGVSKQLYGGLGSNLFNPAMVGFAAVIIAFPETFTQWIPSRTLVGHVPDLETMVGVIFTGQLPRVQSWDTLSQATPLELMRTGLLASQTLSEIQHNPIYGSWGQRGWEWLALAYLLGGLALIWARIIRWTVPGTVLLTTLVLTLPLWLMDPDLFRSPVTQLTTGSLVMCAFFIATDPVSGSSTPKGQVLFAIGVVALTLLIRAYGGFPDGIAFAILIMNMCVPLIDRYTVPRMYGQVATRHTPIKTKDEP